MKKTLLLLTIFCFFGINSFAQYNPHSTDIKNADLLKSTGKILNSKHHIQNPNRVPGDILYNFDFESGLPAGWTTYSDSIISGSDTIFAGWVPWTGLAQNAQYVNQEVSTINSISGGGYMHFPIEAYNTQPGSCPDCADNDILAEGDASITTNWINVSGVPNVCLKFASWFRFWNGEFDIYLYINGDETTPVHTFNGLNINGEIINSNSFPGASSSAAEPENGYNAVYPIYNLTAVAAPTIITTVKIEFRVHSTSHYFWSIDDVQLFEPYENETELVEIYAKNGELYSNINGPLAMDLYKNYNTNYSEVPGNIINELYFGGLLHQTGINAETAQIDFAIDSASVIDIWTGTSNQIENFGSVITVDTILISDTTATGTSVVPEFYCPQFDHTWFENNEFLENGIPYVFKYTATTTGPDANIGNNFQIYEYAQTLGRYSYHWESTDPIQTTVNATYSPFDYALTTASGDMFLNIFDLYQDEAVAPEDEFKVYGMRFYLAPGPHTTFDVSGNGVEVKPILYVYDASVEEYVEFDDVFSETTILNESQVNSWVYLPFDNYGGEIDAIDFVDGTYRLGLYVEDYHGQEFSIGVDTKYHQPYAHSVAWVEGEWYHLNPQGAVMMDLYTNMDQFNYDANLASSSVPHAGFTANATTICLGQTINFTDASSNSPTSWSWNFGDGTTSSLENPTHTYASSATYTVILTATNEEGFNTEIKNNYITVSSSIVIATANIVNSTNGVCNGSIEPYVSGGNAPYIYLWSNSENTHSIDNLCPTIYELTVTDANGCIGQQNFEVGTSYDGSITFIDTLSTQIDTCIFDNTNPVDSALIYNYNLIGTDSIELNWIFWQAGNSVTLDMTILLETTGSNLVYLEIVCNSKSINATNTNTFYGMFDTETVDLKKLESYKTVNIYPNPTTGKITIRSSGIVQIKIYNLNGVLIKSTNNKEIDLSQEAKGIYFVKVTTAKGVTTQKLIFE